ncbi:MAG: hypothetical protein NT011_02690 [Kiritimatiellaeota bacterium]|nr:hypothetical protein [Kiritimatiellota bacterium]
MRKKYYKAAIIFWLCLAIVVTAVAGTPSKETEEAGLWEELMFSHIRKMAEGTFSKNDLAACEAFLAKAEPVDRQKWLVILARYQIRMDHDPLGALKTVGPVLVGEDKAGQWQAAQADAEQKEETQGDPAAKRGGAGTRPAHLLAPFPPVAEWSIDSINAECAVEALQAHLALKEYETAMDQVRFMGPKLEKLARVLASECGGDLLTAMQRYDQAVRFYEYALKWLWDQRKEPLPVLPGVKKVTRQKSLQRVVPAGKTKTTALISGSPETDTGGQLLLRPWTGDEEYLRERITASMVNALRLWDIERYGEDFVLYREAEQMRREEARYLEAYLAYRETEQKYAETMFGEAARAYGIKCLWALAEPGNAEQARKTIRKMEETLNINRKQQTAFRRKKLSSEEALAIQNKIAECERKLASMNLVPLGKAAAKAAGEATNECIAAKEFGLYRGEVIEAKADYCLEILYDPEVATDWYNRALAWFDKAEKMTMDLDSLQVPEKSQAVSAPPPEMKTKNVAWGNIEWAKLEGGKIFNQRTSSWYLPYHRMMAQTKKALCYFIMGKTKEALEMVNIILEVDDAERANYKEGMPNSYSRLKAEFAQGRIFATAEELKSFNGKARVAIMVADYYYEMEQWKEAAERYGQIDREMRKDLNLKARAYLDFMLGNCVVMTEHNDDKALKYFEKFRQEYRNTPTWPRAMMASFMVYQNKCEYDKAMSTLKDVYQKMPDTEWGKRAYYHQGEFLYATGRPEDAQKIFETCLKRYEGTWLASGAGQYLERIKAKE